MKRNIFRPREERNTNDEVKRNTNPKILACDGANKHAPVNAGNNGEAISEPEHQDLGQLVWKYFEEEIRETLMEVQETIQTQQSGSTGQIRQRKQKRK